MVEIQKSETFQYLGSIIYKDEGIEEDMNRRIKVGLMKWRSASRVLYNHRIPIKLKGKFYKTAIRLAILYGTKCWANKKQHIRK